MRGRASLRPGTVKFNDYAGACVLCTVYRSTCGNTNAHKLTRVCARSQTTRMVVEAV